MARTLAQRRAEEAAEAYEQVNDEISRGAASEEAIIRCTLSNEEALKELRARGQILYERINSEGRLGQEIIKIYDAALDPQTLEKTKSIAHLLRDTLVKVEKAFRAEERRQAAAGVQLDVEYKWTMNGTKRKGASTMSSTTNMTPAALVISEGPTELHKAPTLATSVLASHGLPTPSLSPPMEHMEDDTEGIHAPPSKKRRRTSSDCEYGPNASLHPKSKSRLVVLRVSPFFLSTLSDRNADQKRSNYKESRRSTKAFKERRTIPKRNAKTGHGLTIRTMEVQSQQEPTETQGPLETAPSQLTLTRQPLEVMPDNISRPSKIVCLKFKNTDKLSAFELVSKDPAHDRNYVAPVRSTSRVNGSKAEIGTVKGNEKARSSSKSPLSSLPRDLDTQRTVSAPESRKPLAKPPQLPQLAATLPQPAPSPIKVLPPLRTFLPPQLHSPPQIPANPDVSMALENIFSVMLLNAYGGSTAGTSSKHPSARRRNAHFSTPESTLDSVDLAPLPNFNVVKHIEHFQAGVANAITNILDDSLEEPSSSFQEIVQTLYDERPTFVRFPGYDWRITVLQGCVWVYEAVAALGDFKLKMDGSSDSDSDSDSGSDSEEGNKSGDEEDMEVEDDNDGEVSCKSNKKTENGKDANGAANEPANKTTATDPSYVRDILRAIATHFDDEVQKVFRAAGEEAQLG